MFSLRVDFPALNRAAFDPLLLYTQENNDIFAQYAHICEKIRRPQKVVKNHYFLNHTLCKKTET